MNKRRIIQRILVFPAIMIVYIIPVVVLYLKYLWAFLKYGGEVVTYFQKNEVESVQQLYYRLKDETGELDPVLGKDLNFICQISREGEALKQIPESLRGFLDDKKFFLRCLSMSKGTYIANGFNSYIVTKK